MAPAGAVTRWEGGGSVPSASHQFRPGQRGPAGAISQPVSIDAEFKAAPLTAPPPPQGHIRKRLFLFRFGDRGTRMNWVHVRNLVQAHVLAAEALTAARGYVAVSPPRAAGRSPSLGDPFLSSSRWQAGRTVGPGTH